MRKTSFVAALFAALTLATVSWAAHAHDGHRIGALHIDAAHARATAAGQMAAGGYLKINNGGAADKLLSAKAAVSKTVELHTMSMDGEVMRMREVEAIALPAGQAVELKPGGLHLMFMGLKAPLKAGESFPLELHFEKAGKLTVQMKVVATLPTHVMKH
jgi:periplasmic copper chaperone A